MERNCIIRYQTEDEFTTFYNFRDFVERQEQLYSADDDDITPQIPPQIPPEIFDILKSRL